VTTVGLVGAGHMGSALGAVLREGGHAVVTTVAARSPRTAKLAHEAGIRALPGLDDVVSAASIVLVVTPPEAATRAAADIVAACAATAARPLVADLNAVAPSTMEGVARLLADAGLDLVDGSISGAPPTVRPGARIYLSGPRAREVAALGWRRVTPVVVGDAIGTASAIKMCTASVYKGVTGILTQALRTAAHHGVAEHVLADLADGGYEPAHRIAVAATKAWRFVPEMREIAATQAGAGLPRELFEAMAVVYEQLALTDLAHGDPESVDFTDSPTQIVARLTG